MNTLFYLCSSSLLVSAVLIIRSRNPVYSVFHLVSVFLQASLLLILAGVEYFALAQLIIYVGALAIMFLFVVMLLDIPVTEIIAQSRGIFYIASLLFVTFAVTILQIILYGGDIQDITGTFESTLYTPLDTAASLTSVVGSSVNNILLLDDTFFSANNSPSADAQGYYTSIIKGVFLDGEYRTLLSTDYMSWGDKNKEIAQIASLGLAMFTVHVDLLVVACLLLLVAMIAAVVLTLRKRVNIAPVDNFGQHARDFSQIVYKIK